MIKTVLGLTQKICTFVIIFYLKSSQICRNLHGELMSIQTIQISCLLCGLMDILGPL